jgi:Secretion system C-terminal sorting domain
MKKILLSLIALVSFAMSSQAQLSNGSLAKNFTLKDLNGNTHDLYTYLAAGKTVFIYCTVAWSAQSWSYHNKKHLETLYRKHGPTGAPGVAANTTNDVIVLFLEGESANTHAQLYGPTVTTGGAAVVTAGNWVAGTDYPIIDTTGVPLTQFNSDYNIVTSALPIIYKICRDRLVEVVGLADSNALYSAVGKCPTYFPGSGADVKLASAQILNGVNCSNSIGTQLAFQNYSTNTLTAATIAVYRTAACTGTPLISIPWVGSLASYEVSPLLNIPTFAYAGAVNPINLGFKVITAGDVKPQNDTMSRPTSIYDPNAPSTAPLSENFESVTSMPANFNENSYNPRLFYYVDGVSAAGDIVGASGAATKATLVNFYGIPSGDNTLVLGNFNSNTSHDLALSFDYSYARYDGNEKDRIEIVVSKDCGASWTSFWSLEGAALATHAAVKPALYIPGAAADWKSASAIMPASFNDVGVILLGIKATSDYGNYAFVDNINITSVTATKDIKIANNINIYPNPASTVLTVNMDAAATITLTDVMGKVVYTRNVVGNSQINVANISNGVYSLSVRTAEGSYNTKVNIAH